MPHTISRAKCQRQFSWKPGCKVYLLNEVDELLSSFDEFLSVFRIHDGGVLGLDVLELFREIHLESMGF
jgi:hypothetical protein